MKRQLFAHRLAGESNAYIDSRSRAESRTKNLQKTGGLTVHETGRGSTPDGGNLLQTLSVGEAVLEGRRGK